MDKNANDCYIGNYDDDESSDSLLLMSAMNSRQFDFYSKLPSKFIREIKFLSFYYFRN